jgi:hypothetical protein
MVAYALYWIDKTDRDHFIGIVPERRKTTERITRESVLRWMKTLLDDIADLDFANIYFVPKRLEEEILI